jgi:hypothetical protein
MEHPIPRLAPEMQRWQFLERLKAANHEALGGIAVQRFRADSRIACPECRCEWLVFRQPEPHLIRQTEPVRITTEMGSDIREFDSRVSESASTISLKFEMEWSQQLVVQWDRSTTHSKGSSAGLEAPYLGNTINASVQNRFEQTLKTSTAATLETRKMSEATVTLTLKARKMTTLIVNWKQVWEEVVCDFQLSDDVISVPYRRATDVIFDHSISTH